MRKWRQIIACCLTAVLTASGPAAIAWAGSPEFARLPEEWAGLRDNVMEYEELGDLICEYNVTVQKNQLDINDKKKDDRITSDQYAQYYRDAASDYRSAITGDDPLADAQNAAGAGSADAQADKNAEDLTVYQLTYDQEEANLVAAAQSSMISYFKQVYELESARSMLEFQQAVYQSVLARQSAGMATQIDVYAAQESIQNTSASMEKLGASIEETRQKLCIMLGWNYNDAPEIKNIPAVDTEHIASMNPERDKAAALQNNYTLKINQRKLENAAADITKNMLKRTISSNEQNISSDLVKGYQAVLQAKAVWEQAVAEYDLEIKNMDAAGRKHQIGMISQLDYQKQKKAYTTKLIAVKTAELGLFQAVQTYDNGVNGLAFTGG